MIKKCRICGKDFETIKYGGSRQFCYDCVPSSANANERTLFKRQAIKKEALKLLGGKCLKCEESKPYLIDFHHVDSERKEHEFAKLLGNSKIELYFKELEKAIPLCSNCHREFHFLEKNENIDIYNFLGLKEITFYKDELDRKFNTTKKNDKTENIIKKSNPIKEQKEPQNTINKEIIDYELLIEQIKQSSFEEVARTYGVSSNAIRKRLKNRGYPSTMAEIKPKKEKKPKPKDWRELPISLIKENKNFNFNTGNEAIDFITTHSETQRNRVSEGLSRVVNKKRKSYLGYTVQED